MTVDKTLAGAAIVDISPERLRPGRVWMAGYMPLRYAVRQTGPIETRALALGAESSGLLIVTIDTCLLSPRVAGDWTNRICRRVPLPPERVFLLTTHTHSGPDLCGLFGSVPPAYFRRARAGVIEAARRAWENRKPASLVAGSSEHNLGIPRRKPHGQKQHENKMVALQWRSGQEVVATLVNVGCHGVVLPKTSRTLSADLPGALTVAADRAFGGVSLVAPRAQGDINPDIPGKDAYDQYGNPRELERLTGRGLECLNNAIESALPNRASAYQVHSHEIDIRIKSPIGFFFNGPWWTGRWPEKPGVMRLPVREFNIGGAAGIAVPGEVLSCLGTKWLRRRGDNAMLFSYCGGYMGYLMTAETFAGGGYEPNVSPGPVYL